MKNYRDLIIKSISSKTASQIVMPKNLIEVSTSPVMKYKAKPKVDMSQVLMQQGMSQIGMQQQGMVQEPYIAAHNNQLINMNNPLQQDNLLIPEVAPLANSAIGYSYQPQQQDHNYKWLYNKVFLWTHPKQCYKAI
jgi:hypothetical protein